jgi:1-acyl-sn-glycerol-3-phosphate acyltransferase
LLAFRKILVGHLIKTKKTEMLLASSRLAMPRAFSSALKRTMNSTSKSPTHRIAFGTALGATALLCKSSLSGVVHARTTQMDSSSNSDSNSDSNELQQQRYAAWRRVFHDESTQRRTLWTKLKMLCGALLWTPLKVWLCTLTLGAAWIWSKLIAIGWRREWSEDERARAAREGRALPAQRPMGAWRQFFVEWSVRAFARTLAFLAGFVWIERIGSPARGAHAAPVAVCNHVAPIDPVLLYADGYMASPVAKAGVRDIAIVGDIMSSLLAVFVNRSSQQSRNTTLDEITARAAYRPGDGDGDSRERYPPLLLFSEATTTSGEGMLRFKRGAFAPGEPVQPIVLRYPHHSFNPAFTRSNSLVSTLIGTLSQVFNRVQITYMPVYVPSDEERADPDLYAENVRQHMIRTLGVDDESLTIFNYSHLDEYE